MTKSSDKGIITGADGIRRCWWCGDDPLYVQYHDQEWGMPVRDDHRIYEKICLEGFQAGLSWITILRRRDQFRRSFAQFDMEKVARFTDKKVDSLVQNPAIIRHRGKIESTINNARQAIALIESEGSLSDFVWAFQPRRATVYRDRNKIPASTDESTALSKELKRRGWSFVGPTTCYAMMQSLGLVNDHLRSCHCWEKVEEARKTFC